MAPPSPGPTALAQSRALKVLALAALVTLVWLARPVGVGLFLGVLIAFALQPVYERLRARAWRPRTAAFVCMLGAVAVIAVAVAGFATLFVRRGLILLEAAPGVVADGGALRTFAVRAMTFVHVDPDVQFDHLRAQVDAVGSRAAEIATGLASATFSGFLTLLFVALSGYYVLVHSEEIVHHAALVLPIAPRHTRALFAQFRRVGREVLLGTVLTGIAQGALAGVGYWMTGLPDPLFFGALTAVASIVPAVGTLLVWIPAGVYLVATGHPIAGTVELVYGALIVGIVSDYVIRPRLVGRGSRVPAVLTLVSMFGGVEVFGVIGLIVGPVLVALCMAALKTYEVETSPGGTE